MSLFISNKHWWLVVLGCLISSVHAQIVTDKLIHIKSNAAEYYYMAGDIYFTNGVSVTSGENNMQADKVHMKRKNKHLWQEITAYGGKKLAHYWTIPHNKVASIEAYAKTIKFYPEKSLIVLLGEASIMEHTGTLTGDVVLYNIKQHRVTVPKSYSGKANVVIPNQRLRI